MTERVPREWWHGLPHKVRDRYDVRSILGEGGMGVVLEAWDRRLERPVALKLVRAEKAGSPRVRERLRREARAMARVDHPGVAHVLDVHFGKDVDCLTMEVVRGVRLDHWVDDARPTLQARLQVLARVARALAAVHEAGLLHRDVKPANVLVDDDGAPRLMDFGLAKETDTDRTALTLTGQVVGTLTYAAPEVIARNETSVASDVYSLGALAYQTLTGRLPRDGDSVAAALRGRELAPLPAPSSLAPGLDPRVDRTLLLALAAEPARRTVGAAALAEAFEAALPTGAEESALVSATRRGLPPAPSFPLPTPSSPSSSPSSPRRPLRLLFALAAAGALLAAAYPWLAPGARTPPPPGGASPRDAEALARQRAVLLQAPGVPREAAAAELGARALAAGILDRLGVAPGAAPGAAGLYYLARCAAQADQPRRALELLAALFGRHGLRGLGPAPAALLDQAAAWADAADANEALAAGLAAAVAREPGGPDAQLLRERRAEALYRAWAAAATAAVRIKRPPEAVAAIGQQLEVAVRALGAEVGTTGPAGGPLLVTYLTALSAQGTDQSFARFREVAARALEARPEGPPWDLAVRVGELGTFGWLTTAEHRGLVERWLDAAWQRAPAGDPRARLLAARAKLLLRPIGANHLVVARDDAQRILALTSEGEAEAPSLATLALLRSARAMALVDLGRPVEAFKALDEVRDGDLPAADRWFPIHVRAWAMAQSDRQREAIRLAESALVQAPPELQCYMHTFIPLIYLAAAAAVPGADGS